MSPQPTRATLEPQLWAPAIIMASALTLLRVTKHTSDRHYRAALKLLRVRYYLIYGEACYRTSVLNEGLSTGDTI